MSASLKASLGVLLLLSLASCDRVIEKYEDIQEYMSGNTRSLSGNALRKVSGIYLLRRIIIRNIDDESEITLETGKTYPVMVDTREKIHFEGKNTRVSFDEQSSFLMIDFSHTCTFRWNFDSSDKNVKTTRASLGQFKLSGDYTVNRCLKMDGSADVPNSLIPLKKVTYKIRGTDMTLFGTDGSLQMTLNYERLP